MTNLITLTIPNDDHIALRAFGKALEEMALKLNIDTTEATAALERLNTAVVEHPHMEIDTTAHQVESQSSVQREIKNSIAQNEKSLLTDVDDALEQEISNPVDSTNTPWDERIHSTSKALNTDGTWRLRRKPKDMDEAEWVALIESVKGELQYREQMKEETEQSFDVEQQPMNLNYVSIDPAHEKGDETAELNECSEVPPEAYLTNDFVKPPVTPSGEELCIDEGCDHHGTEHICISGALFTPENYVHMYRAVDNIYALAKSKVEIAQFEADGYIRHTQEQYDDWEGPNTADEGDDHHTDAGVVTEQTVAGIPPLPVPPPVVTPPVTDWTFPKVMEFLTQRHGKIDVPTVNSLLAADGMSTLQELNAHPDKIGPFVARVKAHLGE